MRMVNLAVLRDDACPEELGDSEDLCEGGLRLISRRVLVDAEAYAEDRVAR